MKIEFVANSQTGNALSQLQVTSKYEEQRLKESFASMVGNQFDWSDWFCGQVI